MARPVRQLLVLYTGGTIGSQMTAQGWAPASGFDRLMAQEQQRRQLSELPEWRYQELSPPLDSANMGQSDWLTMRDAIVQGIEQWGADAVLLLHGTDTLAYSASALAFELLDLPIPVVLTGAMEPAVVHGSDAWPNLFGAMEKLATGQVPAGVWIFFDGQLLRGVTTSKLASPERAFTELERRRDAPIAGALPAALGYRARRSPVNLTVLPLYPGIDGALVNAVLATGVQGLVLECYGSGSGPSEDQALLQALDQAHQRGVVLLAISQCPHGYLSLDDYAAAAAFKGAGLVAGGGLTREAALGKLFGLQGLGLPQAEVEHWLTRDLCGEMTDRPLDKQ